METAALSVGGDVALAANGAQAGSSGESARKPRKRSDERIQKAHDQAHAALSAVSSYLDADEDLPTFFLRLGEAIAEQVGARKVAFWRLGPRGAITVQPTPFGFGDASPIHEMRLDLEAGGERVLERVVFRDELKLGKGTSLELDEFWRGCGLADVKSSIAVSWRAGERRIGAVVAHDSPRGFSAGDIRVLRLAAMATGLVWQYKEAEDELAQTAVRLEETVAARRRLLNNVAAGGDEARRRFANAIHDDSLQLLTGAELQLERIRAEANDSHQAVQLDQLRNTLRKVEDSLRRLLINVSPEALELRRDLKDAIAERLESMRLHAGIETLSDVRLPADVPEVIEGLVMKNVSEALTNVEKHAHATRVIVAADSMDGGIRVQITDDGTGFVVAESEHLPGHLGLLAMRERAQLAGGWCHIVSEPGAGTKIDFWVPQNL
ncbi:MAG TPA: ATP-binding protein [Candidatus Baltobacterales bacterium]|nr:ATP-binding protein [Candidatus Baltobacterales bacterium]